MRSNNPMLIMPTASSPSSAIQASRAGIVRSNHSAKRCSNVTSPVSPSSSWPHLFRSRIMACPSSALARRTTISIRRSLLRGGEELALFFRSEESGHRWLGSDVAHRIFERPDRQSGLERGGRIGGVDEGVTVVSGVPQRKRATVLPRLEKEFRIDPLQPSTHRSHDRRNPFQHFPKWQPLARDVKR